MVYLLIKHGGMHRDELIFKWFRTHQKDVILLISKLARLQFKFYGKRFCPKAALTRLRDRKQTKDWRVEQKERKS